MLSGVKKVPQEFRLVVFLGPLLRSLELELEVFYKMKIR